MPLSPQLRSRLTAIGVVASTVTALLGALAARDHVRLVDILALFFGGVGAGAGLVAFLGQRRARVAADERARPGA